MTELFKMLCGELSTSERIWTAAAPALFLGSYFFLGAAAYAIRFSRHGRFRDQEMEARGTSLLLGAHARAYFAWVMRPIWGLFLRLDIPPNAITTLSVLLGFASGVSVSVGRFALGGWLYLLAGACDFVDGRLARMSGKASPAGAAFDSTLDRYVESALLVGLAWYYRDSWVLLVVLATITGSFLVPYVRARGEGLGVNVTIGVMQRPERLLLLGSGVALSPILAAWLQPSATRPTHALAVMALLVLAGATHVTALQRLFHVMGKLQPEKDVKPVLGLGQGSLFRNVVAGGAATGVDFTTLLFLITTFKMQPWLATGLACVVGGVVNFILNRIWTFGSKGAPMGEAGRYTIASASSALLNTGGVAVLLLVPDIDYRMAWALARVAVFVAWNYPLHRDYVFSGPHSSSRDTQRQAT
jgi:phosphatidylglycerophosphate synthase/putative flippase GtrA